MPRTYAHARRGTLWIRRFAATMLLCLITCQWSPVRADEPTPPGPLPAAPKVDSDQVALGRKLFFDPRLSGDATISCATCHKPELAWTDGLPLSAGYPGTRYFRNTPTIMNVVLNDHVYWDARLPTSDLETVVRDHLSEAHFMQVDGRLAIERLRQIPEYEEEFKRLFAREPTYGGILKVLAAFIRSQRSQEVPFDQFITGDSDALSESAQRGFELFQNKAGCIRCHDGPLFTDGASRSLGIESNPEIFRDPQRHITFRRFFRTLGVPNYSALKQDPGCYCISKQDADREQMKTPTLRELRHTAPYMHDGQIATLEEVVAFYNAGGGPRDSRDSLIEPLDLTDQEQSDLVEFLESLSGTLPEPEAPQLPRYKLRTLGAN